mmetsp:Transcript_35175/g.101303  ORF Transcript_35175/g.101303 Transcript_35175/m.101303 type:complete len:209 (+) Transcript_35175:1709-2335(+)
MRSLWFFSLFSICSSTMVAENMETIVLATTKPTIKQTMLKIRSMWFVQTMSLEPKVTCAIVQWKALTYCSVTVELLSNMSVQLRSAPDAPVCDKKNHKHAIAWFTHASTTASEDIAKRTLTRSTNTRSTMPSTMPKIRTARNSNATRSKRPILVKRNSRNPDPPSASAAPRRIARLNQSQVTTAASNTNARAYRLAIWKQPVISTPSL